MTKTRALTFLAAVLTLCLASATGVVADTLSGAIFAPDTALLPYPTPYASVLISIADGGSNTATVTYTALTQGAFRYTLGATDAVGFNVNAASYSYTFGGTCAFSTCSFQQDSSPWSHGIVGFPGGTSLNLGAQANDGYTQSYSSVTLTLTNLSGTWANAAAVRAINAEGFWVGGHIFVCQNSPTNNCALTTSDAVATGFAAGAATPGVPEPGTLTLVGSAVLLIGAFARRLRK